MDLSSAREYAQAQKTKGTDPTSIAKYLEEKGFRFKGGNAPTSKTLGPLFRKLKNQDKGQKSVIRKGAMKAASETAKKPRGRPPGTKMATPGQGSNQVIKAILTASGISADARITAALAFL